MNPEIKQKWIDALKLIPDAPASLIHAMTALLFACGVTEEDADKMLHVSDADFSTSIGFATWVRDNL